MSVLKIKKPDGTWESINGSTGTSIELDTTLKISGKAADAKAVGDKINALPNIVVQPDEPSSPVDGMLWLDTDAESLNNSTENSSNSFFTKEIIITSDNATLYPNDDGGGSIVLNNALTEELQEVFNACDLYKSSPILQFIILDLHINCYANYISGSDTLRIFKNIQFVSIKQAQSGLLSLYTLEDNGNIETNDDNMFAALNSGMNITLKFTIK